MAQLLHGFSLSDVCKILGKHHGTISRLATKFMKCPKLHAIAEELVQTLSCMIRSARPFHDPFRGSFLCFSGFVKKNGTGIY